MKRRILYVVGSLVFVILVVEICAWGTRQPTDLEREALFIVPDPELGWKNRPGFTGDFVNASVGYHGHVTFDSRGLRSNGGILTGLVEKRVLLLGDSTTAGLEVNNEETYASVLERLFWEKGRAVRVYNAGVRGYGTDQSYLQLKKLVPLLHPDVVVYIGGPYSLQQLTTIKNWYRVYSKPAFALVGSTLLPLDLPVRPREKEEYAYIAYPNGRYRILEGRAKPSGLRRWLREHSFLFGWLEGYYYARHNRAFNPPPDAARTERLRELGELLVGMQRLSPRFLVSGLTMHDARDVPDYDLFKEVAEQRHVPFLDIRPYFKPGISYHFGSDGHWNPAGHRQAAEALAALLEPVLSAKTKDR